MSMTWSPCRGEPFGINFFSFFSSEKRIKDTISELPGSSQWLAISQQKFQLLLGLPSLSLRPDSWEGGKIWNMITSVGLFGVSCPKIFRYYFTTISWVTQISVWSSLWFQKIVTRFWGLDEPLGLPTNNLLMVCQGGREFLYFFFFDSHEVKYYSDLWDWRYSAEYSPRLLRLHTKNIP